MRRDYISMSDDELERLSEMRDAKGRLTDVAMLDFYDGERDDRW